MTIRTFEDKTPRIATTAYIDAASLVLGDVVIGEDSSVWPMTVIRGDVHSIQIGARSNIQDSSVLHVTHDSEYVPGGLALKIGDDVTVGHRVILHACTVGDRCLIGMGSTILDGAILEDEVMLGAASLVPTGKRLESGFLYVGAPAKKIRPLTEEEKTFLCYSAESYVKLSKQHLSK